MMLNAELIVPMATLCSLPPRRLRTTIFHGSLAVFQPPGAHLTQPAHHIHVGSRRIQNPGKYRHISLGLFALKSQRRASIPIMLRRIAPRQIAVQGLTTERQLLQPVRIQPCQCSRSLNNQLLYLRTPAVLSHLLQAIAPFAPAGTPNCRASNPQPLKPQPMRGRCRFQPPAPPECWPPCPCEPPCRRPSARLRFPRC